LRDLPCFETAHEAEIAHVQSARSGVRRLPAGSVVYADGDPLTEAYTLFDGWALRAKTLRNGRRQVLSVLLPGDTFGASPHPHAEVDHTAETVTDVALCAFPHRDLVQLFSTSPAYAWRLSWVLASEQRMLHEHLTVLGRRSAYQRVGFLLLEIYTRLEQRRAVADGACEFPLRQEDCADFTGLSLETVNRQLARMSREGLAHVAHGQLTLLDRSRLARAADFRDDFLTPKPLL
jgi:CRP-like cAMP-binding protein